MPLALFALFVALGVGFGAGTFVEKLASDAQERLRNGAEAPLELDGDNLAQVPPDSLLVRASRGEESALQKLTAKTPRERTLEEVVALSEGRVQTERDEAWAAGILFASQNFESVSSEQIQLMLSIVGDPRTFREGLLSLAKIQHPIGADLIYQASRNYRHLPEVAAMAEELLGTQAVRAQASPELTIVIDSLAVKDCGAVQALLERTLTDGDSRAVRHLVQFAERSGCGVGGQEDCYSCLRASDLLTRALRSAQDRRAPHWQ